MMKTIGMIGGITWESTALYYRVINRRMQETLGGVHSAKCLLYSVDFAEVADHQHTGNWAQLQVMLENASRKLAAGGADFIIVCANTVHKVTGTIESASDLPLLHIADPAGALIRAQGLRRLGLIATRYSMEQNFLRDYYREKFGIETRVPDEPERAEIHRIIYSELAKGVVDNGSRRSLQAICAGLIDEGAEGIILGCTELELLLGPGDLPVPSFPTASLHAEAAVAFAVKK